MNIDESAKHFISFFGDDYALIAIEKTRATSNFYHEELFDKVIQILNKKNKMEIIFQEENTSGYKNRTIKNATADATIAIAIDFTTAGEKLTKKAVIWNRKKYIPVKLQDLTISDNLINYIIDNLNLSSAKTLNIAGNGIYSFKGNYTQNQIDNYVYNLLYNVINSDKLINKIELIRTGGQTGVDESGAKAGIKLNIKTMILAPKGWKYRNINAEDISNEELFKDRFNL